MNQTAQPSLAGSKKPGAEREYMLARDPSKAIQDMMNIIDTLRDVYARETEALENSDTRSFMALQEEKLEAASAYQTGAAEIISRREEMKNVSPVLKKKLEEAQKDFSKMAGKNLKSIERMQRCVKRLGDTIRNAARDHVKKERVTSYGENGRIQNNQSRTVSMGVSETV